MKRPRRVTRVKAKGVKRLVRKVASMQRELKLPRPKTSRITLQVLTEDYKRVKEIMENRGSDFNTWLQVTLHSFERRNALLDLNDAITFGKFAGVKLEAGIRLEPRYFQWLRSKSDSFRMTQDGHDLLDEMLEIVNEGNRRAEIDGPIPW